MSIFKCWFHLLLLILYTTIETSAQLIHYDLSGRIVKDENNEIDTIYWNRFNKVSNIVRKKGSKKSDYDFLYDARGRCMQKVEKPRNEEGLMPNDTWIYSTYTYDVHDNIIAVYKASKPFTASSVKAEYAMYQSGNYIGSKTKSIDNIPGDALFSFRGEGNYTLHDHVFSSSTTISDRLIANDPETLSADEYYPFGMHLPDRAIHHKMSLPGYANSENLDTHIYQYSARLYDAKLGRFFTIDPLHHLGVDRSPYSYASNSPIEATDYKGLIPVYTTTQQINGIHHITIHIPIYIRDQTHHGISQDKINDYTKEIRNQAEVSFAGSPDGGKTVINMKLEITQADRYDPVQEHIDPLHDEEQLYIDLVDNIPIITSHSFETAGLSTEGGIDPPQFPKSTTAPRQILISIANRTAKDIAIIGAHELGHTLGLYHVEENREMGIEDNYDRNLMWTKLNSPELGPLITPQQLQQVLFTVKRSGDYYIALEKARAKSAGEAAARSSKETQRIMEEKKQNGN